LTIFAQQFTNCCANFEGDGAFHPHLATRPWQQWLITMWFWSFCCNRKPVEISRRPRKTYLSWLAKSATDSKMLSSSIVRSLLLHLINLGVKTLHSTLTLKRQGMQSSPLFPWELWCSL